MSGKPAYAAAVHDPEGRLTEEIRARAGMLEALFSSFAFSLTPATDNNLRAVLTEVLSADIVAHPTGEEFIGLGRRNAVIAAANLPVAHVLYSDLDHMLRWIDRDRVELEGILDKEAELDLLVIGRSARAFGAEPRRLQETERLVNHIFALTTGRQWDLMFAMRRFSRAGAQTIMAASTVESLANDAEWPLLALQFGLKTGYAEADGLFYRTLEAFSEEADAHDDDPVEWIRRLEFALDHARVIEDFTHPLATRMQIDETIGK